MDSRLVRWVTGNWWGLLATVVSLGLLPLLLLCYYNQPYADDFSWTPEVEAYGFWGAQRRLFINWSGRYFTNWLQLVGNPLNHRWLQGVQLTAIISQLLRLIVLYAVVRLLTGRQLRRRDAGLLAAGLALVYSSMVASTFSALYYFTEIVVYQVPAWLLLLVPLAIDRLQRAPRRSARWIWGLLAGAGIIAVAGSNELTIALLSVIMLLGTGLSLWRRQWASARVWVGLGTLLAVAGAVALLAPGNTSRLALDNSLRPSASIQEALARLFSLLRHLLTSPAFLVIPAFVLLLRPIAAQVAPARPPGLRIPLLLSAAVLLAGLIVGTLPYALTWARIPLIPRAANILIWWWLLGWLLAGWASLPVQPAAITPIPAAARGLLGAALAAVIVMASGHAYLDLRHEAPAFAAQWQSRFATLKQAGLTPHSRLTLQPQPVLINRQIIMPPLGLAESPDYGINTRLATWFGLDSVRVGAVP
ncbi:DUF6056 family protein [Hymenobacter terrestris]|uniref:Glycosyltransferase RgtA/B/C/D-like domain-containing protein n=1 Tax=Hymenobacter terrestris TaxID=2748310 RepID=A0ABX2Q3Z0_9BACT|nr:DUF6056 family protein [Hymenobacter terrestris]NVO84736.1 hypothetical protein [Hymenobacter terrestris]